MGSEGLGTASNGSINSHYIGSIKPCTTLNDCRFLIMKQWERQMVPCQHGWDEYYFFVQGHGRVSRRDEHSFRVYSYCTWEPTARGRVVHVTIHSVHRMWHDRMAAIHHPGVLALAAAELSLFPSPGRLFQLLKVNAEMVGEYSTQSEMWMNRFTNVTADAHVPHGMARVANTPSATFIYEFIQRQMPAIVYWNQLR